MSEGLEKELTWLVQGPDGGSGSGRVGTAGRGRTGVWAEATWLAVDAIIRSPDREITCDTAGGVWTARVEAFMGSELEMGPAVAVRMEKRGLSRAGTHRE